MFNIARAVATIGLLALLVFSPAYADGIDNPIGSSSATPSGPAGGDLSGTYPNPSVATYNGGTAFGTAASANTGTSGATLGFLNGNLTFSGANAYGTPASITLTNATGYPKATNALFGIVEVDNTTITASGGVISAAAGAGPFCALAGCTMSGALIGVAGSATTPGVAVGVVGTGLYSVSTTGIALTVNAGATPVADWGVTASNSFTSSLSGFNIGSTLAKNSNLITTATGGGYAWVGSSSPVAGPIDTVLTRRAAGVIQCGAADAASPSACGFSFQSVVAGTSNTAGANATIQGSLSTGSGLSGDIVIRTGGTGAAATVQNSAVDGVRIKGGTQHFSYGGSIPVVSACGSGTPAIDTKATDSSGTVTTGTVATTCTVTFAKAYTTFNHCRVSSESSISGLAYSYTLSALVVTASVLGGDAFDYDCDGI